MCARVWFLPLLACTLVVTLATPASADKQSGGSTFAGASFAFSAWAKSPVGTHPAGVLLFDSDYTYKITHSPLYGPAAYIVTAVYYLDGMVETNAVAADFRIELVAAGGNTGADEVEMSADGARFVAAGNHWVAARIQIRELPIGVIPWPIRGQIVDEHSLTTQ
jgi:hypothetical protein